MMNMPPTLGSALRVAAFPAALILGALAAATLYVNAHAPNIRPVQTVPLAAVSNDPLPAQAYACSSDADCVEESFYYCGFCGYYDGALNKEYVQRQDAADRTPDPTDLARHGAGMNSLLYKLTADRPCVAALCSKPSSPPARMKAQCIQSRCRLTAAPVP